MIGENPTTSGGTQQTQTKSKHENRGGIAPGLWVPPEPADAQFEHLHWKVF